MHLELEGHIIAKHLELYQLLVVPPNHQFFERFSTVNHPFWGTPPIYTLLVPPGSVLPPVGVSVDGLLVQIHVEVPALAGLDAVSAILCAACLVPVHLNCSWCRFLLWVWFGPWGMSSICCCFCCFFC